MNVCPVLPTVPRPARQGVLAGDDEEVVNGLGRFKLGRVLRPRLPPQPHELLMRRRRHRRRLARGIVSRPGVMPAPTKLLPLGFGLSGYPKGLSDDAVNGLGFSFKKLGKKLRKVASSKLFKYAAIGAATYFTAGAAAPLLSKIGKAGIFKGFGGAVRGALPAAAKAYGSASAVQPVPGSAAAPFGATDFSQYGAQYGGGGGGGYGASAGGGYDANAGTQEQDAGVAAGGGLPKWIIPAAIGVVLVAGLVKRSR